jgi:hypothetical protein
MTAKRCGGIVGGAALQGLDVWVPIRMSTAPVTDTSHRIAVLAADALLAKGGERFCVSLNMFPLHLPPLVEFRDFLCFGPYVRACA